MTTKRAKMTERKLERKLAEALDAAMSRHGSYVNTFEDDGVMSGHRGLVIHLANGQSFQLSIVESTCR